VTTLLADEPWLTSPAGYTPGQAGEVATFLRRVVGSTIRRRRLPFDTDELLDVAWIGYLAACRRFDPSFGVPFTAYAVRRVEGAVIDGLRRTRATPEHIRLAEAHLDPLQDHFTDPTQPWVADRLARALAVVDNDRQALLARWCWQDGLTMTEAGRRLGTKPSEPSRQLGKATELVAAELRDPCRDPDPDWEQALLGEAGLEIAGRVLAAVLRFECGRRSTRGPRAMPPFEVGMPVLRELLNA
jgi:RNA polymerase sigma factor (sigma-70 family)